MAALALLASPWNSACSSAGGDDDDDDGDDSDCAERDPGDPALLVGTFEVELVAATAEREAYTSVVGAVYDGEQPSAVIWEKTAEDGECALFTPRVPFCATACGADAVCVEDDVCEPYATRQPVGTVTVRGLLATDGATEFSMEPIANNYQPTADVDLAYPPFAEGDAVELSASCSDFAGAFELSSAGIAPLALTTADLALERDQALELTWDPPAGDESSFAVYLDISHHGGSRGKIECTAADDGTLTIAPSLVTGLLDLGAAGYPTIIVTRDRSGSAVIPAGRVDLHVRSQVEEPVEVPGVTSCTEDNQCPDGQTCRDDLTCG